MNGFYTGEIDDELFLDVAVVKRAGPCTSPIEFEGISTEEEEAPFHVVFGSRYWMDMLKSLIIITMPRKHHGSGSSVRLAVVDIPLPPYTAR